MTKRTTLSITATALIALVTAACNEDVETADVENNIRTELDAAGVEFDSVDCDDDVEAKVGETFSCTITGDGEEVTVNYEITAVTDDSVEYRQR